jgi:hypothetical protein
MSMKARFLIAAANQFLAPASAEVSRYFPDCQEGAATLAKKKAPWCVRLSHPFICEASAERPSGDRLLRLRKSGICKIAHRLQTRTATGNKALTLELRSVHAQRRHQGRTSFDHPASC